MTSPVYAEDNGRRGQPDPVDVHVGRRLRARRQALGMSQEMLARAVGVTFQQVQKYERGANRISASRLYDIALMLQVPINYFFDHMEDDGPRIAERLPGLGEPPPPALAAPSSPPTDEIDLLTAYRKLPEDIQRKSLTLLRSMANLRDKKGEPLPDD